MYTRPILPSLGSEPNGSAPVFTGPKGVYFVVKVCIILSYSCYALYLLFYITLYWYVCPYFSINKFVFPSLRLLE